MKIFRFLPPALLVTGAIYRAAGVMAASIWYDEAASLYRTTLPFWTLAYDPTEYSGCLLLDLVLRPLMLISPGSLFLLRLPSLLASFGCLELVWVIMRRMQFSLFQQTVTAALAAFLPGLIWMAQDARVYSLLAMFGLAAFWFALEGRWLGLTACAGLMLYSHNTGAALAGTMFLIAIFLHRDQWKRFLIGGVLVGIGWIPVILRTLTLDLSDKFWALGFTFWRFVTATIEGMFVWTTPGIMILLPFVLLALTLLLALRRTDKAILFYAWAVPLLGFQMISGLWKNVIIYRTLGPLVWFLVLWIGYEVARRPFRFLQGALLIGWLLTLTVSFGRFDPAIRGGGIEQAADLIRSEWQDGDAIFYTTHTAGAPFSFYLGDKPAALWDGVDNPFVTPPGLDTASAPPQSSRLWIVTPGEPLLTRSELEAIDGWISGADLVTEAQGPQFAPIYVYRKDNYAPALP